MTKTHWTLSMLNVLSIILNKLQKYKEHASQHTFKQRFGQNGKLKYNQQIE